MEISYNPTYSPTASESESPQHHSTREQQKKSVLLRRFVNAVIKSLPTVMSATIATSATQQAIKQDKVNHYMLAMVSYAAGNGIKSLVGLHDIFKSNSASQDSTIRQSDIDKIIKHTKDGLTVLATALLIGGSSISIANNIVDSEPPIEYVVPTVFGTAAYISALIRSAIIPPAHKPLVQLVTGIGLSIAAGVFYNILEKNNDDTGKKFVLPVVASISLSTLNSLYQFIKSKAESNHQESKDNPINP